MSSPGLEGFTAHPLDETHRLFVGQLTEDLLWPTAVFESAWELRPANRHQVVMAGKRVELPRDQQAFGATYKYTGSVNWALPIPSLLKPLLEWSQSAVEPQLNGLLLNWYQGSKDYIGPHHDSIKGLIPDTPIVTISFGEARVFRLTKWQNRAKTDQQDFKAAAGRVFVMPWETNQAWKHEVLKRTTYRGRRISVTLRAFAEGVLPPESYWALA